MAGNNKSLANSWASGGWWPENEYMYPRQPTVPGPGQGWTPEPQFLGTRAPLDLFTGATPQTSVGGVDSLGGGPIPQMTQPAVAAAASTIPDTTSVNAYADGRGLQALGGENFFNTFREANEKPIYYGLKPSQMNAEQLAAFYKDNQPNQTLNYVNAGIGAVGAATNLGLGIYGAYQANKQFGLQERTANMNLAAQLASYNQAQADRVNKHYSAEDLKDPKKLAARDAELERRQLKEPPK